MSPAGLKSVVHPHLGGVFNVMELPARQHRHIKSAVHQDQECTWVGTSLYARLAFGTPMLIRSAAIFVCCLGLCLATAEAQAPAPAPPSTDEPPDVTAPVEPSVAAPVEPPDMTAPVEPSVAAPVVEPSPVAAPPACEDEACARAAYDAGASAFEAADYLDALAHFQRSYEQARLPALLFNMASCHDRLGASEDAVRFYRAFVAAQPEAENRPYVESRVLLLERPQAETSDAAPPPGATAVPIAPDFEDGPSRAGPITLLVLGGAAAVGAVIAGVLAAQSSATLEENCDALICPISEQSTYDGMRQQALVSDVLSGVALGLATAGILWWVIQPSGDDDDQDDVQVQCGIRGCAVSGVF